MIELQARTRRWGNSIGIALPKDIIRKNRIKADSYLKIYIPEKQAGIKRNYEFEISAPVGFEFAETETSIWTYKSADPPGRLVVKLTLKSIPTFQE